MLLRPGKIFYQWMPLIVASHFDSGPTVCCIVGLEKNRAIFIQILYPIFTDVMVNDPATALSLNSCTSSFSSFNAIAYNKGR